MESKEEKFKRLAVSRVNKTLKQIRLLGNLSNQSLYEYPDRYIPQIEQAIQNELKEISEIKNDSKYDQLKKFYEKISNLKFIGGEIMNIQKKNGTQTTKYTRI